MEAESALPAFRDAMATAEPPMLGPKRRPGTLPPADLERALSRIFDRHAIPRAIQPQLRSAALLWHDHLDASHEISQGIETRDGSWLHGIMHRREPDYGNAKYWFRRVGQHDSFPILARRVAHILHDDTRGLATRLIENGDWLPSAFVDECERAESDGDAKSQQILRAIQALEFDVLLEHIFRVSA